MKDELYYGMRQDIFLPPNPITPPENKQGWKLQSEYNQIREDLIAILGQENRLPDDKVEKTEVPVQKKLGTMPNNH